MLVCLYVGSFDMAGLGAQDPVSAGVALPSRWRSATYLVARRGPSDLATPTLSWPEQAS